MRGTLAVKALGKWRYYVSIFNTIRGLNKQTP